MSGSISRGVLLSRGARLGAAALAGGLAAGPLAEGAAAALPSGDLAYARLLVGAELLAADFYGQALAARNGAPTVLRYLRRAAFNEQEHYQSVAGILSGSGVTPAVSGDITFSYPTGTFATQKSIVAFATQLETAVLGAYLGAVGNIQTTSLLTGLAEIAACEAQHVSYFTVAGGGRAYGQSFPPALTISAASAIFDNYTS